MKRIILDANLSWLGRIVQRLGETSMGRKVQWAKRLETPETDHYIQLL